MPSGSLVSDLFHLKLEMDDEAQVLAHRSGKRRYARWPGVRAGLGFERCATTPDARAGQWGAYRYRDRTSAGVPRFATFPDRLTQHVVQRTAIVTRKRLLDLSVV
jgi:hypothetical protein